MIEEIFKWDQKNISDQLSECNFMLNNTNLIHFADKH